MNEIFIVIQNIKYEDSTILGVFDDITKAINFKEKILKKIIESDIQDDVTISIKKFELNKEDHKKLILI